jgi:hypothetical protein
VDEPLIGLGRLREAARGDAGVADIDEQALGGVEKRLFGLVAGR